MDLIKKPVRPTARAIDPEPHFPERGDVVYLHVEGVLLTALEPAVHQRGEVRNLQFSPLASFV